MPDAHGRIPPDFPLTFTFYFAGNTIGSRATADAMLSRAPYYQIYRGVYLLRGMQLRPVVRVSVLFGMSDDDYEDEEPYVFPWPIDWPGSFIIMVYHSQVKHAGPRIEQLNGIIRTICPVHKSIQSNELTDLERALKHTQNLTNNYPTQTTM